MRINDNIRFFKNGVNTDIYIGKGAGKKLLQDIENARSSVKIISPFLSPFYIEKLIQLKHRGIDVSLITSDDIEDYNYNNKSKVIYELIQQVRYTDEYANAKREKLKILNKRIIYTWISLTILIPVLAILLKNFSLFFGLIIVFSLIMASLLIKSRIKNKKIYSYEYETLFPFRVFISPQNNQLKFKSDYYIHSKIFIIDNSIAYLGSINFSRSGMEFNFESRIRTTDTQTIEGLNNMFSDLFNSKANFYWDITSWGKKIYREPIN